MNVESAKKAAEFVSVAKVLPNGEIYRVPGHDGRVYFVRLLRTEKGIEATCRQSDRSSCLGNTCHGTVCYHTLAALIASHKKAGKQTWCKLFSTKEDAEKLANIDKPSSIERVFSSQGQGEAFYYQRPTRVISDDRALVNRFKAFGQRPGDSVDPVLTDLIAQKV